MSVDDIKSLDIFVSIKLVLLAHFINYRSCSIVLFLGSSGVTVVTINFDKPSSVIAICALYFLPLVSIALLTFTSECL